MLCSYPFAFLPATMDGHADRSTLNVRTPSEARNEQQDGDSSLEDQENLSEDQDNLSESQDDSSADQDDPQEGQEDSQSKQRAKDPPTAPRGRHASTSGGKTWLPGEISKLDRLLNSSNPRPRWKAVVRELNQQAANKWSADGCKKWAHEHGPLDWKIGQAWDYHEVSRTEREKARSADAKQSEPAAKMPVEEGACSKCGHIKGGFRCV